MILRMSHVCKDSVKVWAVSNSFSTVEVVWAAYSILLIILPQIWAASSRALEVARIFPTSLGLVQLQECLVGNQVSERVKVFLTKSKMQALCSLGLLSIKVWAVSSGFSTVEVV